jgi:Flp pilus assembly protein TadB
MTRALTPVRRLTAPICALVALAATLAIAAPPSMAATLQVSPASGANFPDRALVLSVPPTTTLTSANVHITENGRPVRHLAVTPLGQAGPGGTGVILMIDTDPSMAGAPLNQALAAARTLASERANGEEIGVIFGDGTTVPLTAPSGTLERALAHPPNGHSPLNLLQMTEAAVSELKAAGIADRTIIYVTDDIDSNPHFTPESVGAYATAAHVRIFTVGVPDAIWTKPLPDDLPSPASMRALAASADGTYITATPAQERKAFLAIAAGVLNQYLIGYLSEQPAATRIAASVRVDGVPGVAEITYTSPRTPPAPATGHRFPPTAYRGHHQPFWGSSLSLLVSGLVAAILTGFAVAALVAHFSRSGLLRARVEAFLPGPPPGMVSEDSGLSNKRQSALDRVLERRRWWSAFTEQVDIASFSRSPQALVRFAIAASLVTPLLLDLLTGSLLLALIGLATGPVGLRLLVRRSVRKQRLKFAEQLPGQLHELASAMRTGRSLIEGLAIVADGAEEPMRRELQRVLADERAGRPVDEALLPVAERMESSEVEQVSAIAALHRRTGANITEVLDRIADTARQRVDTRRELTAMTAQARMSRNTLISLPVFVTIAIDIIGHGYERPLFHTTLGIVVIAAAAMMVMIGARIMKSMVKVEE